MSTSEAVLIRFRRILIKWVMIFLEDFSCSQRESHLGVEEFDGSRSICRTCMVTTRRLSMTEKSLLRSIWQMFTILRRTPFRCVTCYLQRVPSRPLPNSDYRVDNGGSKPMTRGNAWRLVLSSVTPSNRLTQKRTFRAFLCIKMVPAMVCNTMPL